MEGPTPDPTRARNAVEVAATSAAGGLRETAEKLRAGTISAEDWDLAARAAVKAAIKAGALGFTVFPLPRSEAKVLAFVRKAVGL